MPWEEIVLKAYLEEWADMSEEDYKRKIAKIVIAGRRTLDPTFKAYWNHTAKTLATKYKVSLSEIEKCPEYYNEVKVGRIH
jgi:hypothetical protein